MVCRPIFVASASTTPRSPPSRASECTSTTSIMARCRVRSSTCSTSTASRCSVGGKNNIGGAIKIYSQKPQGDNSGYLEASYGSYNEIFVRGMMDVSIIPDRLFLRASVTSRNQDGYVTAVDYACRFGPGNNAFGP